MVYQAESIGLFESRLVEQEEVHLLPWFNTGSAIVLFYSFGNRLSESRDGGTPVVAVVVESGTFHVDRFSVPAVSDSLSRATCHRKSLTPGLPIP